MQTLDELLMLNLDVITHVITWFITLIADNGNVKQELRDEITANKADIHGYLAKTDSHLHRCFVESMRVRPFAGKFSAANHASPLHKTRAYLGQFSQLESHLPP